MPWFPDFASAGELARQQTRAAGLASGPDRLLAAARAYDDVEPPVEQR
jgi:hypothetical protein